ncbi:MAG: DUF3426 domain-containing protein [Hyphomicrobiales bacterium]|nr:DUF3426 domain-containing protein [Hyphomicrobiales bacterium]
MSLTYDAWEHYPARLKAKDENCAAARQLRATRRGKLRLAGLGVGLGALLLLGAWAKPGMVVRLLPRMAEVYASIGLPVNLRGLAFEHVAARYEEAGKGSFLTVEGLLRNIASEEHDVPRLRVVLADKAGRPVYSWTASSGIKALPPGETAPFRARLAAPPAEAQKVTVDLAPE